MRKVFSFRLSEAELGALRDLPGETHGQKLRALIHMAGIDQRFTREVEQLRNQLSSSVFRIEKELGQIKASLDSSNSRDAAAVRAALELVIEHALLPPAPMDRKPGLRQALELLKNGDKK